MILFLPVVVGRVRVMLLVCFPVEGAMVSWRWRDSILSAMMIRLLSKVLLAWTTIFSAAARQLTRRRAALRKRRRKRRKRKRKRKGTRPVGARQISAAVGWTICLVSISEMLRFLPPAVSAAPANVPGGDEGGLLDFFGGKWAGEFRIYRRFVSRHHVSL